MTVQQNPATVSALDVRYDERRDFWFPHEMKEVAPHATGTRAGPLLFLSAQSARNQETGRPVRRLWDLPPDALERLRTGLEHRDGREGPIRAQTWTIYDNLARVLGSQGSSLEQVVRQRVYLRNPWDVAPMEEVMLGFFPAEKPATTVSLMSSAGLHPAVDVQVEIVALVAGEAEKEAIRVPGLERVTGAYPQAVRVGQMLFFSGIAGINPDTGRPARSMVESPEPHPGARGAAPGADPDEQVKAQVMLMFSHMRRVLESAGGTLDDVVRQNYVTRMHLSQWGATVMDYRPLIFSRQEAVPTSAALHLEQVNADPETMILGDAVAILPGEWTHEGAIRPDLDMAYLPMVRKAGPLAFTTGYVGMNKDAHAATRAFEELTGAYRSLGATRVDDNETVTAQAYQVYAAIDDMLRSVGSSLSHVVQQSVFMRDAREYPAVERVAALLYGGGVPATTVVPIDDLSPFAGMRFEVDVVAVVP